MKRTAVFLALGLVLSACTSGTNIGGGIKDLESITPSPSKSSEPTKKPSKSSEPTKKPSESTPTKTAAPKGNTFQLKIRNNGNGFEPDSIRLNRGDTIVFTNEDPVNQHQWVENNETWKSPVLSNGEKYTLKMDFPPGRYDCRDGKVPYIVNCFIEIL